MNTSAPRQHFKSLVVFVALFFVAWSLRATVLYVDKYIASDSTRWFFAQAVKILLWIPPVFLYLKATAQPQPLTFLKLTTPIHSRAMWQAAGIIIAYLGGMLAFAHLVEGKTLSPLFQASGSALLLELLRVPASAITEEIFFRGFLLSALEQHFSFWRANVIQAALFVLIHWPFYLWTQGFTLWLVTFSISIFIIGLTLGWLVRLTNSLWPSAVLHIANNFLVSFLKP